MLEEADILGDLDQLRSRYDVLRHLGQDGGCAVYAVRARSGEQHYLVKVMPKPGSGSAQTGTLHLWQAHTMARLDHPKLIGLHTVNHLQGGTLALAMERRRGETLAERIERAGPLPVAEVESTLRDVAEALAYLHGRGVVHRGVDLDSVLLDRDSACARLAHFGIPRGARGVSSASGEHAREPMHRGGERARAAAPDPAPASDLYSLGLVGYAILTGRELSASDSAEGSASEPLPPLESLRPDAPSHLCRAIEGCLERDPRRRWRDARELLLRLDASAADAPPVARPEPSWRGVDWKRPLGAVRSALTGPWDGQRRRNVALALPAALLVVVAWAMLRPDDVPAPPAADRQRVTTAVPRADESTRLPGSERRAAPVGTLPAVGPGLAAGEPGESPSRPSGFAAEPAVEAAISPLPEAAQRPRRSVRSRGTRSAPSDRPLAEAPARRRPPVPLLGEELASSNRGR